MCELSHRIREKPNWWESIKDKAVVEEWREEALQRKEEDDEVASGKLTPTMVKSRSHYHCTAPPCPHFALISRLIMCSKNSTDMHLCVIQRLA